MCGELNARRWKVRRTPTVTGGHRRTPTNPAKCNRSTAYFTVHHRPSVTVTVDIHRSSLTVDDRRCTLVATGVRRRTPSYATGCRRTPACLGHCRSVTTTVCHCRSAGATVGQWNLVYFTVCYRILTPAYAECHRTSQYECVRHCPFADNGYTLDQRAACMTCQVIKFYSTISGI